MASIPGTILASKISPGDTQATFPTHIDIYGHGGLMCVNSLAEILTIPTDRQKLGMMIYNASVNKYYTLTAIGTPYISESNLAPTSLLTVSQYLSSTNIRLQSATITQNLSVMGNVTVDGNLTFGNEPSDSNTFRGTVKIADSDQDAIVFGSGDTNYDTNLYRSAADTLKTDDTFVVALCAGIGTDTPQAGLHVSTTDAIIIPIGTTAERVNQQGAIRYNSELSAFEGYGENVWGTLGGVKDTDQDTYISPEDTPGADNDELKFVIAGQEKMKLDSSSLTISGDISGNNLHTSFNKGSATGNYSFAVNNSQALGSNSYAAGLKTVASGSNSTTIGSYTSALHDNSFAGGLASVVKQRYNGFAFGNRNKVTHDTAVALGGDANLASGPRAHVHGNESIGSGYESFVEGTRCGTGNRVPFESYDAATKTFTFTPENSALFRAEHYGQLQLTLRACLTSTNVGDVSFHNGTFIDIEVNPDGLLAWTPNNTLSALSVYYSSGPNSGQEVTTNIGSGQGWIQNGSGWESHAEGYECVASGFRSSHAEGKQTLASGHTGSHAEGYQTTASGPFGSHAEGWLSLASGQASHAEGVNTKASGDYGSHAEGNTSVASGPASHAEGTRTTSSAGSSHAEGADTISSGYTSHAEGSFTKALGNYSHAEGDSTTSSNWASHAEGYFTEASGHSSHAEGYQTTASGNHSHAEGYHTKASGHYSHAAGLKATAAHSYSYAWSGDSTLVENVSTTRSGQYMVSASGGVFIPGNVGIGTDDNSRALTVSGDVNITNGQILSANTDLFSIFQVSSQVGTAGLLNAEQGGVVGQNISTYTEALSNTIALRSEDGDTLFRWVNATSTGGFNAWRESAGLQENGNKLTWQGLTLGSFDTSYTNNYFDGNIISFADGYIPATTTYEGTQSKIRVATITDPTGLGSPAGAIVRDFTFPTTGGELVTDTDFNSYKTNVASATGTLVLNTDFDSYKTNVASATGTLVLNTDFDSYKTNVASATATALQDLSYNDAGTLSISDSNSVTLSAFNNVSVNGNLEVTNGQILSAGVDLFNLGFGTIDGTGTQNYIAKWSDTDTITDSSIVDDGLGVTVASTLSAQNTIYTQGQQVVKTPITTTPGISAITAIVAVSALPVVPVEGTLYILI